jgi:hypothetical protein
MEDEDENHENDNEDPWPVFDKDGDCTFCYFCLDLAGYELFVCDFCRFAVHFACSRKQDKLLKIKSTLTRDVNKKWECHYCREIEGLKNTDPIAAFKKIVEGNTTKEEPERKNLNKTSKRKKRGSSAVCNQAEPARKKQK